MCAKNQHSGNNQQGSSLMEALLAMVLIAILLNGAVYLTSSATDSQTDQQLVSIAVSQMQMSLRTQDVCTTAPTVILPGGVILTAQVQGCGTTSATINGTVVNGVPTALGLRVSSTDLGGQVVVGGTWTGN